MKKALILFIFMVTVFTVKAQSDKPTKEQTINFIDKWFDDMYPTTGVYETKKDVFISEGLKNHQTSFDTIEYKAEFTFEFDSYYTYQSYSEYLVTYGTYYKNRYKIDLSKIESIGLVFNKRNSISNDGTHPYVITLRFKCAEKDCIKIYVSTEGRDNTGHNNQFDYETLSLPIDGKQVSDIEIPVANLSTTDDFNHYEHNKKILQAFNHLRKLAGAPEEINFGD